MALLENLFKKKTAEDRWVYCLREDNGEISSIYFNKGIQAIAPIEKSTYLCCFSIKLLPESAINPKVNYVDLRILKQVEKNILKILSSNTDLHFATVVSTVNLNIYFYSKNSTVTREFESLQAKYKNIKISFTAEREKKWSTYFKFLVFESEFNKKKQAEIIEDLVSSDPNVKIQSENIHDIAFKTKNDLESFIGELNLVKFKIISQYFDSGKKLYHLEIKLKDKISTEKIKSIMVLLWHLANSNNGRYSGYEVLQPK